MEEQRCSTCDTFTMHDSDDACLMCVARLAVLEERPRLAKEAEERYHELVESIRLDEGEDDD